MTEINALTIDGGQYDSAVNVALNIGDASWPDALAAGNSHGVVINIINGVNTDGAESRIDNVSCVHIRNFYCETSPTSGIGIRLGGYAAGSLRNVDIDNSFFKNVNYAIYCATAVNGLEVGRNFYTEVRCSALYCTSDLYHVSYTAGDATASFTQGKEFHTGFRSLAIGIVDFANFTIPAQGLYRGAQRLLQSVGVWYPGGELKTSSTISTNSASSSTRFYESPASAIAGTVSGGVFTFTTLSDCYSFNGGDRIVTAPAGATYVRSVDYVAGTMVMDGGSTAPGAATVSQQESVLVSQTSGSAAPTSGAWRQGDVCQNSAATVGQPKAWRCTVDGTPGTWVSEGNL